MLQAKQPTPQVAAFPAGLQGRFLSLSSLLLSLFLPLSRLIYRSLKAASESSQRVPSTFQGIVKKHSQLVPGNSSVVTDLSHQVYFHSVCLGLGLTAWFCATLSNTRVTSHCQMRLLGQLCICAISHMWCLVTRGGFTGKVGMVFVASELSILAF